jgi:hypothetical protein
MEVTPMKRLLIALVVALPLGFPEIASADWYWVDPVWSVKPTVTEAPPDSIGSATYASADDFFGYLTTYAENSPGPGGGTAIASLDFSRSFRMGNTPELITLNVMGFGSFQVLSFGGSTISFFDYQVGISGPDSSIAVSDFMSSGGRDYFGKALSDFGVLRAGELYTVRGQIELLSSSLSGGLFASGDVEFMVELFPPPSAVPEPSGLFLLGSELAGCLGAAWLRRKRLKVQVGA